MFRTLIVDDEAKARKNILLELKAYEDIEIVGQATNANDALEQFSREVPDLLFLDIQLGGSDGFEMLDRLNMLGYQNFDVIFLTAYKEYSIKAIKYQAFDYLLKPIDPDELREAILRLRLLRAKQKTASIVPVGDLPMKHRIKTSKGYQFLDPEEIVYVEADSNYTLFHLKDSKHITVCQTLKEVEEDLAANRFIRVHKGYLINLHYLKSYRKDTRTCQLKCGELEFEVPVSTRMLKNLIGP